MIKLGVPKEAFGGDGSMCFFSHGKYLGYMRSVIGGGTYAVWRKMEELFRIRC